MNIKRHSDSDLGGEITCQIGSRRTQVQRGHKTAENHPKKHSTNHSVYMNRGDSSPSSAICSSVRFSILASSFPARRAVLARW